MNEALELLDGVVQLTVVSKTETAPLAGASDGDRYLVPAGASGAFTGQSGQLAWRDQGVWRFLTPVEGWVAWIGDTQSLEVLTATGWQPVGASSFTQFGINATADSTTRLAIASDAVLFNHDGGDHRMKVNRAEVGNTASLLFQTAFSGTAEFGLCGALGPALRTSADGSNWQNRLVCPDGSPGLEVLAIRSGEVSINVDAVETLPAPDTSGLLIIWSYETTFPNMTHSAILLFDAGASPLLLPIFLGENTFNFDSTSLTGTCGDDRTTNISVQTGEIQIENRRTDASVYRYIFLA